MQKICVLRICSLWNMRSHEKQSISKDGANITLGIMNSNTAVLILIAASFFVFVIPMQSVHAVITFSDEINLSNDNVLSSTPQVALSGNNDVYVIWLNSTPTADVFFTKSTSADLDDFDAPINLSNTITGSISQQQIATSGNNVYVVWRNDTATADDIFFKRSTDNGVSFSDEINLSTTTGIAADAPQIATSGNNVYVVFKDGPDIFFTNSTDNGATFDPDGPFNLSSGASPSPAFTPQIVASGKNVYIVWRDGNTAAADDIFFRVSTDNGNTFNPPLTSAAKKLSITGLNRPSGPQIATSGTDVYVVWRDNGNGDFEMFFANSTDNGATFDPDGPFNLSNDDGESKNQKIKATGNNVYVTWENDPDSTGITGEILFRASTDNGNSFDPPFTAVAKNLSDNTGLSQLPQMATFDDSVYVFWQDKTLDANGDILFRSSSDNGATFSGTSNISNNTATSQAVQAIASDNGVHVVWQDDADGDSDILFRTGTAASVDVVFDSNQYKLSSTATITVTDASSNLSPGTSETINVNVASTTNPAGILLVLSETGLDTGIFTGTLTFTTGTSSSGTLQAAPGNTITATFGGQTGTASIFSRDVNFGFATYDRGALSHITVTDQNSNLFPGVNETISVNITSTADPVGIMLSLTETNVDTGIFGGTANNNLIFMEGNDLFPTSSSITVTAEDTDETGNGISNKIEQVGVKSTTDPIGIILNITEYDDTGIFNGTLTLTTSSSDQATNKIKVTEGDFLTIGNGLSVSRALVIPNPNLSNGAIQVTIPDDNVTATYLGSSDIAEVEDLIGGGGGGGGISRAGLVVNVVAGLSLFGGGGSSGGNSPPSFGTSSFAIIEGDQEGFGGIINDNDTKTLDETKIIKVGQKSTLRFDFTEGGGIGNIEHIGLYTNIRDGQKRQDSDAYIYYDPLKLPQLTIHDPNGIFSEVSFDLLKKDATHFVLKFDIIFAKTMATSDIILESWNLKKWSTINKIPNAIEVISSGIIQEEQSEPIVETFVEDVINDQVIPVWVKSNAKWWSEDEIDNEDFISGIEYLVNEGIIKVSLPDTKGNTLIPEMQPWIKNNAGWWADEMISDNEFLTAIEWLISNDIIQVV